MFNDQTPLLGDATETKTYDNNNTRGNGGREETEEKPKFQSQIGTLLTCLGCAVGTGNIWRFPRIVANNSQHDGGLVFIIIWTFFLFLWSMPMLVIEYGIGRYTRKAVIGSFMDMISKKVVGLGAWIVSVSFLISCYYSVILGWCIYYTGRCAVLGLPDNQPDSKKVFDEFAEDSLYPVLTMFCAILLTVFCVVKGVKTIEKVSKVLVPSLLLIIACCFIGSLTLSHGSEGLLYLFTPHWKSFGNVNTWIDALSQNAFDTGAGSGLMVAYASYMSWNQGIVRYAVIIPTMNNVISLICGMTIFSGVFSTLISSYGFLSKNDIIDIIMDSGPGSTGLTFIWLPVLFSTMGAVVGRIIAVLFFLCLSFAGLTSLISNMELFILTLTDFGVPRKIALCACPIVLFGLSLFSALNTKILDNQDFVWGFALVINGLVFVGVVIYYGVTRFWDEVVNQLGSDDWKLPKAWKVVVLIFLPIEGIGLILLWALDLLLNPKETDGKWTEIGEKTFATTIIEWGVLLCIIFIVNIAYIYYNSRHIDTTAQQPEKRPRTPMENMIFDNNDSSTHPHSGGGIDTSF